jgi:hypothetical protein
MAARDWASHRKPALSDKQTDASWRAFVTGDFNAKAPGISGPLPRNCGRPGGNKLNNAFDVLNILWYL